MVESIYKNYQLQFTGILLTKEYLDLFHEMSLFVQNKVRQNYKYVSPLSGMIQSNDTTSLFDHFTWIQKYVNPLYKMNQTLIFNNHLVSLSYIDYSMNCSRIHPFLINRYIMLKTPKAFLLK